MLDDREGIPITLSVLYMELARRLGLKMEGVGLPGHFVVRHVPAQGEPQLIDAYNEGKPLLRADAENLAGTRLTERLLAAATPRQILVRMLYNLRKIAEDKHDPEAWIRYVDAILTIAPDTAEARAKRAEFRLVSGDREGALADVDWLLEKSPEGIDLDGVRKFRELLLPEKR